MSTLNPADQDASGQEAPDLIYDILGEELLGGRYRVMKKLGQGGLASVYLAFDTELNKEVAVKVLFSDNLIVRTRLIDAGAMLAQVSHPNIVGVEPEVGGSARFHSGSQLIFIVLEYVKGETLDELVKCKGTFSLPEALELILTLCDAMDAIHKRNIFHRDIKPANLMLTDSGTLKLIDFNISRWPRTHVCIVEADRKDIIGSMGYMSPEMIFHSYSNSQGDIFGAGLSLYYLLLGDHLVDNCVKTSKEWAAHQPLSRTFETALAFSKTRVPLLVKRLLEDMLMLDPGKRPLLIELKQQINRLQKILWCLSWMRRLRYPLLVIGLALLILLLKSCGLF